MSEDPKIVLSGLEAREKLLIGVNKVADVVKMTLGPNGRNALIDRDWQHPRVVNDGVFIAKQIILDDEVENIAARVFVEIAQRTNEKAGDGTTTSIVLGQAILEEAMSQINKVGDVIGASSVSVTKLRNDITEAGEKIIKELKKSARKATEEDLINVAKTSVEDQNYGKIIAEMVQSIGIDGYVDVTEGHNYEVEWEVYEGMKIKGKYANEFLSNTNIKEAIYKDTPIVVSNYDIKTKEEIKAIAMAGFNAGYRSIVVCAYKFSAEVIENILNQNKHSGFQVLAVKVPSLTNEEVKDIAIYTNATFLNSEAGSKAKNVGASDFGFVKRIKVDADEINLIGGSGSTEERLTELKEQMELEKDHMFRERYKRRIAALSAKGAIIRAAAPSETEGGYWKLKFEDAVNATQAALAEGVVKGGGLALKEIADKLPKNILTNPIKEPYKLIQQNAGGELKIPDTVLDPLKVTRIALENAVSAAGTILTTESIIVEKRQRPLEELKRVLEDKG